MIRFKRMVWAVALAVALATQASAANVALSLNLEFNTPGDLNSGGTWLVVGKADERGIAGVSLLLDHINFDASSGFLAPAGFEVRMSTAYGTIIEIVQGDDMLNKTLDVGVVGGPFPSSYVDPSGLVPISGSLDLGPFTGGVSLATGSFNPGVLPNWTVRGSNVTAANVFSPDPGNPAVGATVDVRAATQMTVRFFAVPEPATMALAGMSLVGVAAVARRFKG